MIQQTTSKHFGFALPTVLIASVVMLSVLSVAVTSVTAVRNTIKNQYYEQLAKTAGEAGVAFAKACLAKSGNVPQWSDANPLTPSSDCAGNQLLQPQIQVLAVAGGGGGGDNHAGGGGGGGVLYINSLPIATGNSFTVTVGAGGAGGSASVGAAGANGSNSSFGAIMTAIGGGGGGGRINDNSVSMPTSGGSGGGSAGTLNGVSGITAPGGFGTFGQGNSGGSGSSGSIAGNGGGGGGAGSVGGVASGTASGAGQPGAGGSGFASDVTGSMVYYGAGGAGGRWGSGTTAAGGISGGGSGGIDSVAGLNGLVNSGGGGGGGGSNSGDGGAGGSGIVVVRYANNGSITATAPAATVTNIGSYKVYTFKTVGSSNFSITAAGVSSCPSDPRCSVLSADTFRSSFSIGLPTLNQDGKAVAIGNTGYVELIRKSDGSVWRRYNQPSVQAAVVPDLCSAAATSGLGWSNAVVTGQQDSLPGASTALSISLADASLNSGQMYFRRDFAVTAPGIYTLSAFTPTASDKADVYIDGTYVLSAQGSVKNAPTASLSIGCHTVTVQLNNKAIQPRASRFSAAIQSTVTGSVPIVATDSSWRVSAGAPASFASPGYYTDPDIWAPVVPYSLASSLSSDWSTAIDQQTPIVATSAANCAVSCPAATTSYLKDSKDFVLSGASNTLELVSMCDDDCTVYINGQAIINHAPWPSVVRQTVTLPAGNYRIGVMLYNSLASFPSGVAVLLRDKASGTVIARTNRTWESTRSLTSGVVGPISSFEASFIPSPNEISQKAKADILVVAGGGGGGANSAGGGGGGGLRYAANINIAPGVYSVQVGGGGAGAANSSAVGSNGGVSSFGSLYSAVGGGGGASRDGGAVASVGGSGGGGSGTSSATAPTRDIAAAGTDGQGSAGGNGTAADASTGAKGGGGGGAGYLGGAASTTVTGNGGAGYVTYLTGSRLALAGGGVGSNTASNGTYGTATDGGGASAGAAGTASTGGGGAGGSTAGGGGAGGSGIVIFRFKTGTMSVSATGSYTVVSATIGGVGYSSYVFTGAGSLTVASVNDLN